MSSSTRPLYPTHVEIDLSALRRNALAIRERVGDRKVLAAVKADAYGHGAVRISQLLEAENLVDWLGVATVTEGIVLREAGITLPILKLSHAFPDEIPYAINHNITLAVVDEQSIDEVAQVAQTANKQVSVHLALDTGMRRIGTESTEAVHLARKIADAGIDLQGIFTHLPVSDTPEGADFTRAQLNIFITAVEQIQADRAAHNEQPVPLIHASNSAATMAHDLTGCTMVRPGIALYGSYPDAQTPRTIDLEPVLSMRSKVSLVKRIKAGESVSYGRTWVAPTDRWIATVPVGYADGFNRLNSNKGRMLINGRSFPVAGRVCMDQTMLDVGEALDFEDVANRGAPSVKRGSDVTIIGANGDEFISTDELANLAGTISYEVTSVIPPRVTRVYVDDDKEDKTN